MSDNNGHENLPGGAYPHEEKFLQELKAEKFAENPDMFICIDDIVLGFVKESGRTGVFCGNFSRGDIKSAHAELDYKFMKIMMLMEAEMAEDKPKIVSPGSPIMTPVDFARRKR